MKNLNDGTKFDDKISVKKFVASRNDLYNEMNSMDIVTNAQETKRLVKEERNLYFKSMAHIVNQ